MKLTVKQDKRGLWRWHLTSGSKIIADSGEGYATASNARRAWRRMQKYISTHAVTEVTE